MNPEDVNDDEFVLLPDDGTGDLIDEDSSLTSLDELASRVRQMYVLRKDRDATKLAADNAKEEFETYQAQFFHDLSRSPIKGSITVDLGEEFGVVQITPKTTIYARVLDKDKAQAYFEKRAKTKEVVKQDFQMKRLHEIVRACMEQRKPLPDGLDFRKTEYFQITEK